MAIGVLFLVLALSHNGAGRENNSIPLAGSIPTLGFQGLLQPSRTLELGIPVEGRIETVFVERGDRIDPGDVVARLDSSVERASLRVAESKARSAAAEETAQVNIDLYSEKVTQFRTLYKKGVVTQEEMTEAITNLRLAELEMQQAREARDIARLEAEKVRAQLARREIVSRVSGVVVERYLSEGELVTSGESASVVRVAVLDPLRVELIVSAEYFRRIRRGSDAVVSIAGFDIGPMKATVTVVDQVIDARSGTFGIRLELPNPDHTIPAGVECHVGFEE